MIAAIYVNHSQKKMIEKFKAVNNPLTIIAIFACLAEIASGVTVIYIREDLQYIFIWFLIGFPVLLVVLFFITLNFNHKVLYAPSDFRNDENFLQMLNVAQTSKSLSEVQMTVDSANAEIEKLINSFDTPSKKELLEKVNEQFQDISEKVSITKEEFQSMKQSKVRLNKLAKTIELNDLIIKIHKWALTQDESFTITQVVRQFSESEGSDISEAINDLIKSKHLLRTIDKNGQVYFRKTFD